MSAHQVHTICLVQTAGLPAEALVEPARRLATRISERILVFQHLRSTIAGKMTRTFAWLSFLIASAAISYVVTRSFVVAVVAFFVITLVSRRRSPGVFDLFL